MNTRLPLRPFLLLLAALSWLAFPVTLSAGPGGGGGHGGGGGGHAGGGGHNSGGSHGGGHSGQSSHAPSGGHLSGPSVGNYGRAPASSRGVTVAGPGFNMLSSFVPDSGSGFAHPAAATPELVEMAAHGWTFLPSAGISRPATVAHAPVRPVFPVRPNSFPSNLPLRPRPRAPFGYYPYWGYGFGGPCLFNGFTSFCGWNPFWFGYGANYCLSGIGFYDCGYGAYGYPYAPGYGWDWTSSPGAGGEYESPDNSGAMDMYEGYVGSGNENAEPNNAAPRQPLTQIILKNGSAYEVTAYWVSNGELYYRPVTGGLGHVPLEQLDLSATVAANSRNGVTFTITDHPPEQ